jgi:AraC family transcriptional activator of pobA
LLADREKRKHGFSEVKKGADLDYTLLFKDLLEKSFTGLKNVSAYAQKLHVSEKRLGQATYKVLGKTPKELINARILLEAKRLLVHGNQSIKEIGFQLGFEEPTNFIKYFRKHTNKTPVRFRESYL